MARLYDAIEPEVVSMNMLQRAVELSRADGENQVIPKEDKLDYSEVRSLRLDFRSKFHFVSPLSPSNPNELILQIFFGWKISGYLPI